MSWSVEQRTGSAADFHARPLPSRVRRTVSVLEVDRPALVLGSTQPEDDADRRALDAAGVALVRRRSGGGAVLLRPGAALWVDVEVPADDPLWEHDVGRAFHWVGTAWATALGDLGVTAAVHTGGLVTSRWSRLVCFAGVGPGEVRAGGRKLVGISQRRTRAGARFQCVLLRAWEPEALLGLLALAPAERVAATADLLPLAAGLDRPGDEVVAAFAARLPGSSGAVPAG